jgi:hypothetical protein
VAGLIGGIRIVSQFYERIHQCGTYGRLSRYQVYFYQQLNDQVLKEVTKTNPDKFKGIGKGSLSQEPEDLPAGKLTATYDLQLQNPRVRI